MKRSGERGPYSPRWGEWVFIRPGLVLLSLTIAFLGMESLLRSVKVLISESAPPEGVRMERYDPLLGWRGIPAYSSTRFHGGVHLNGRGFRDIEVPPLTPHPGRGRILVLGDSFVWGYNVRQEDAFPAVLRARLGQGFEVVSMGVPGFSTDQELLLLDQEGLPLAPDVVILALFPNDLFDNGNRTIHPGRYQKPCFSLEGDRLRLTNVPVPRRGDGEGPSLAWNLLSERWVLLWEHLRRPPGFRKGDWSDFVLNPAFQESPYWTLSTRLLLEFRDRCASNGCRFLLLLIPLRDQMEQAEWGFPNDRLAEFASGNGIEAIDLRWVLTADDYLELDFHWKPSAHRKVAEELERRIAAGR